VAMIVDAGEDAFVTMVATLPHLRGRHLASDLLRAALHEARQRGQTTTSLQASKLGQGIYARLGYRPLGEVHLYEKRPQ
jgi:ribosomal protein S18 acetylase RimI-like enzyme